MFGKKKNAPVVPEPKVGDTAPLKSGEVYIMPEKYLLQLKKPGSKNLLIPIIILLALIASIGGYLLYDILAKQSAVAPVTVNPPQVQPLVEEMPLVDEIPEAATTTADVTAMETSTLATTTTATATVVSALSIDSDNDGLTDVEETVFGSSPTNPDTDGDGYKDGIEVLNSYNPTKPGTSKLIESPFIASLTTAFASGNYSLLYPKEWSASVVNANNQLLITANTGEIIKISLRDNSGGLSPLAWYLQDHPEVAVSQLRLIENANRQISGIFSPDGFLAYLANSDKSKFYVFEYLTGRQTEFRYPAIFSMIIKNLQLLPEIIAPTTTPSPAAAVESGNLTGTASNSPSGPESNAVPIDEDSATVEEPEVE